MERSLQDRLDRREAGAASDEHDRLRAVLAQEEAAERTLQAKDVALLILLNTWSVKLPPATWRMCSSISSSACGGCAIEKLRRSPPFSRKSMYWPAWNCRRSFAGSLRCTIITSSAVRDSCCTRQGSRRT